MDIKPPAKAECSERKDFGSPSTGWRLAGGRPCSRAAKGPHPPRVPRHAGAARPRVGRCGSHARRVRGRLCSTGRRFFCTRNSQKRIKISTMVLRSVKMPAFWVVNPLGHGRLLRPPPSRSLCPHRCPCSWPGRGPGAGLCAEGGAPAWPRTRPACPPVWAGLLASASLNTHLIVRRSCAMTLARENPSVCVPALGDAGTCQT